MGGEERACEPQRAWRRETDIQNKSKKRWSPCRSGLISHQLYQLSPVRIVPRGTLSGPNKTQA
jgi:hypothetical protein